MQIFIITYQRPFNQIYSHQVLSYENIEIEANNEKEAVEKFHNMGFHMPQIVSIVAK